MRPRSPRPHLFSAMLGAIALMTSFAATAIGQDLKIVYPDEQWRTQEPANLGCDAHALDELARRLEGRGCVIKDGWVVKSWGSQSQRGDWASSAKPVLSTLLFFAIQEGKLSGVDAKIVDHGWPMAEKDQTMTFAHLANMTSGYARPEPPGQAWAYNDFAIQLYQKTLFDRVLQEDPNSAAAKRFAPLRLEDGLDFDAKRRRLKASVRDFARISWLWLNKGQWNGRQVLARRFFDDYQRPHVPSDLPVSRDAETNDYLQIGTYGGGSSHFSDGGPGIYGFNWWFNAPVSTITMKGRKTWPDAPDDAFMSIGAHGNCSIMVPSRRLVLVAAQAKWGEHQPGDPNSVANRIMKLLVQADGPNR